MKKQIVIIMLLFSLLTSIFPQKLTPFKVNGNFGYVDQNLQVAIPPQYSRADPFEANGLAYVISGESVAQHYFGIINTLGVLLFSTPRGVPINVYQDWYVLVKSGRNELINVKTHQYGGNYNYLSASKTDIDLIPAAVKTEDSFEWGYVTTGGDVAFTFKNIRRVYGFNNGRAVIENHDNGFAVIDKEGNFIVDFVIPYSHIRFSEDLLAVRVKESSVYKTGYMDRNGNMAFYVPIELDGYGVLEATPFKGGFAAIMTSNEAEVWRIINKKGEYVSGEIKVSSMGDFRDGFSQITIYNNTVKDYRYGFMGTDGVYLAPAIFESVTPFANGFAQIVYKGRDGLLDTQGRIFWSADILSGKPVPVDVMDLR